MRVAMQNLHLIQNFLGLLFILISANTQAQVWSNDQDLGTWFEIEGTRLKISMNNDSICSFEYIYGRGKKRGTSYQLGNTVRGISVERYEDSILFYRPIGKLDTPRYEVHIETYLEYAKAKKPSINISHYCWEYFGTTLSMENYYSLDGANYEMVKYGESIGNLTVLPDSILTNQIWEKIELKKDSQAVSIEQYFTAIEPPKRISKEGFPLYFERIKLVKHPDDYWTLENIEDFEGYNMEHFKEIRLITWEYGWRDDLTVNLDQPHNFIKPESISTIVGSVNNFEKLDWTKYPNAKRIEIVTDKKTIDFSVPGYLNVIINADSTLRYVDLLTQSDSINWLFSNVPIRKHDFNFVNHGYFNVKTSSHLKLLAKQSGYIRSLRLDLSLYEENIELDASFGEMEMLMLICDTIELKCENITLGSLDSLVIYGHSMNYDFLKCPNQLTYLGVYYSNENTLPLLKKTYPNLEYHGYCFPSNSKVSIENNEERRIDEIRLGDKVRAIDSAQRMVESAVTAIEYHFNVTDSLMQLYIPEDLVSIDAFQSIGMFVQFTPGHPLNGSCDLTDSNRSLYKECSILTTIGEIDATKIQDQMVQYNGTLINIRTAEGNFFINDVSFLNK